MKKYIFFAAALLSLAACNKDGTRPSDTLVEICLTSSLGSQTRATHGLDTQIGSGETVRVWVDDAGTGGSLYEDNALTVGSDGTLSGETTMYYPVTGNTVDIYAVHGNFSDFTWGGAVTHSVAQDQSSSAGYAQSDLLWGRLTSVARTKSAVTLTFSHLLSKVEVVVKAPAANLIKKLEILNTELDAGFTPSKNGGFSVTASGSTGTILLDTGVTTGSTAVLNEAILVPQTVASGTDFICITTDQGGELTYTLNSEATFEAGKKYRYTITVDLEKLSIVSVSIASWDNDDDTIDAQAELQ